MSMHLHEYARATGINMMFILSVSMLAPVLAPYIKSMGFDNIQLSLIFSLMPLAIIFASPVIGRISDDIGRRTVLLAGIFIEIAAVLLYAFGGSWHLIALARVLDAVAATTVTIAVLSKIEDTISDKSRGKYTGVSLSFEYVGRLLGPVAGGLLADQLFIRAPFVASVIILIAILLLIPQKGLSKRSISRKDLDWLGEIRTFLSHRQLKGMAVLGIVMHATLPALTVFLPLLVVESMGLSYVYVGYAYFALGVTHILQFVFGMWSEKKTYRVVLAGCLISGIFLASLYFVSTYYMLLALLFFKGIGNSMWNISAWTLMSKIGEKEKIEGGVVGAYISIAKIGAFLSFVISGFVVALYGINSLFLLNGVLIIIGVVLAYPRMKD